MTQLELHQKGLLDLIKGRGAATTDAYLVRVARSAGLGMIREIAIWWRAFQIEAQCRFTSRLLKRLGLFDSLVATYFNTNGTSPYVEELSQDFLLSLETHENPLVRAVAEFERAFLAVRAGSAAAFDVLWDRNPDFVFLALERRGELPTPEPAYIYHMQIARNLPAMIQCTREPRNQQSA